MEFRADLNQSSTLATAQATLESYSALPTILTIRTKNEGGAWRFDEATRFKWFSALAPQANGVDVELNSPCARAVAALAQKHGKTLILSCHFFTVPWNLTTLRQQAGRAAALGADIFKFAATAERPPELALLREFLMYWNRGRPRGRKLVLAPMGAGGCRAARPLSLCPRRPEPNLRTRRPVNRRRATHAPAGS